MKSNFNINKHFDFIISELRFCWNNEPTTEYYEHKNIFDK